MLFLSNPSRHDQSKAKSANYRACHYAIFANPMELHPCQVEIFFSELGSQTPSIYFDVQHLTLYTCINIDLRKSVSHCHLFEINYFAAFTCFGLYDSSSEGTHALEFL
jgi:hypothetical protein